MMFRSYSNISKYFLRDYVTKAMVIILVTMATPISSHVKDKNSMFTACDEDMIFAHGRYVTSMSLVGSSIALTHSLTHSLAHSILINLFRHGGKTADWLKNL